MFRNLLKIKKLRGAFKIKYINSKPNRYIFTLFLRDFCKITYQTNFHKFTFQRLIYKFTFKQIFDEIMFSELKPNINRFTYFNKINQ